MKQVVLKEMLIDVSMSKCKRAKGSSDGKAARCYQW